MTLTNQREAIRHLLNERQPGDAAAAYFAFHHPDSRTHIVTYPTDGNRATGYITLSRTGMDLFRPFLTLRLPPTDMNAAAGLIYAAMPPETAVILQAPANYRPLLQALFDIQTEDELHLYQLDHTRFKPIINVMVVSSQGANGHPRFTVRSQTSGQDEVVATAGINWQSPYFAELFVNTGPLHRRQGWGRSVVAAAAKHVLENGRFPLYTVTAHNKASIQLAQNVGFFDTGYRRVLIQATLRPDPRK